MFIEDMKANQQDLFGQLLASRTTEELHFLKGRNDVYQSVIGLEEAVNQVRAMQELDDE